MGRNVHDPCDNFKDLPRLIQSIQRIEGNPDCFGTACGSCIRLDCKWRDYWLKEHGKAQQNLPVDPLF